MIIPLPPIIAQFMSAHSRLVEHFGPSKLRFTLDGRLVGDIAEALACEHYGLTFPLRRTPGVDLLTNDAKSVQVKCSGIGMGPAFSPGEGRAHYLLFLLIDFNAGRAEVAYNGPEEPVRRHLPMNFTGTKRVSLATIRQLDSAQSDRIQRKDN